MTRLLRKISTRRLLAAIATALAVIGGGPAIAVAVVVVFWVLSRWRQR